VDAGRRLRNLAVVIAEELGIDMLHAYARRLERLEAKHVLGPGDLRIPERIRIAHSWRDLQLAQAEHDATFHADVWGMSKRQQLLHFALHLAKLAGRYASITRDDQVALIELSDVIVPDVTIFGIKLATVMNVKLADAPFGRRGDDSQSPEPHGEWEQAFHLVP